MNDFETLKNDWKSVKTSTIEMSDNTDSLLHKLKRLQRKIILSNLVVSICFAFTFIVIGWIWSSYDNPTFLFHISLISMNILLLTTLVILWYRVFFWKTQTLELHKDVKTFINIMLKKLIYYKWITNIYMPVYMIILAIIILLYFQVILKSAGFWFSFWAYLLSFSWILIVGFVSIRKKEKKNKKEIDPIIQELRQIKGSL